jgi:hypothetical protein
VFIFGADVPRMNEHYRLFGLHFASELEIAGLEPAKVGPVARSDVTIRSGAVSPETETTEFLGMAVCATPAGLYIEVPEVARFRISDGAEIIVDLVSTDAASARDHLLGTAMGAMLHQRGYLPLHANLLAWNGRAYAFAGASGAGKSTLAARLQAQGYGFLSDDICAVDWDEAGRPRAWPGIPRLKLWRDALAELSMDDTALRPLAWTADKFEAPVPYSDNGNPLPLAAIYDLREEADDAPRGVHPLAGVDAVNTLVAHTYRRRLTDFEGKSADYLRRVLNVVGAVPIFSLRRRWGFDEFDQELRNIHQSVTAVDATQGSSGTAPPELG